MILTGSEIQKMVLAGRITIDPYDPMALQPNSYDLRLGDTLRRYDRTRTAEYQGVLDPRKESSTYDLLIPPHGIDLHPGNLYLGSTIEVVGSEEFVPRVDGKSSLGRLGVLIHLTAGFVDLGFRAALTLEIAVVEPVRVYAGMPVCQVSFSRVLGDREIQYQGRYKDQQGPTPSRMWVRHDCAEPGI